VPYGVLVSLLHLHALKHAAFAQLENNLLDELPAEIMYCTALSELRLAGNRLGTLPPSIAALPLLATLDIASKLRFGLFFQCR